MLQVVVELNLALRYMLMVVVELNLALQIYVEGEGCCRAESCIIDIC